MDTKNNISLRNRDSLIIHSNWYWDTKFPFFEVNQERFIPSLNGRVGLFGILTRKIVQNTIFSLLKISTESSPATEKGAMVVLGENGCPIAPFFSFDYIYPPFAAGWTNKYRVRDLFRERGFGILRELLGGSCRLGVEEWSYRKREYGHPVKELIVERLKGVFRERVKGVMEESLGYERLEELAYQNQMMVSSPLTQQVGYYFCVMHFLLQFMHDFFVVN